MRKCIIFSKQFRENQRKNEKKSSWKIYSDIYIYIYCIYIIYICIYIWLPSVKWFHNFLPPFEYNKIMNKQMRYIEHICDYERNRFFKIKSSKGGGVVVPVQSWYCIQPLFRAQIHSSYLIIYKKTWRYFQTQPKLFLNTSSVEK